MAIIKSGILGPFRKKAGAAVGRRHKGQNVMTGLPRISNKKPTAKQIETRLKLGILNSFLSTMDTLVTSGFKAYTKHNSEVNAAFSYNYKHAFVKQGDQWLINYPKMVYSRGHILSPEGVQVIPEEGKIIFSWLPQNQSAYCQFSDMASFFVYNPVKETSVILSGIINRYAQSYTMQMPLDYIGETVHCYMSFNSADGKKVGDSLYVGEVEVV